MKFKRRAPSRLVRLPGGSGVRIRQLVPDDRAALIAFFGSLDAETAYWRFAGGRLPRPADIDKFTHADQRSHGQLVALTRWRRTVIGHAMYVTSSSDPTEADIGLVVTRAWQGRGVGTTLLEHLARQASAHGIRRFTWQVETDNELVSGWLESHGATRRWVAYGQAEWVIDLADLT